jgi:hypothetical protein
MVASDQLLDVGASILRMAQPSEMHRLEPAGHDETTQRFLRDAKKLVGLAPRNQR